MKLDQSLHQEITGLRQQLNSMEKAYQQSQAELQQLKTAHHKFACMVEQAPIAMIEWNQNLEITAWNKTAETIFGYGRSEMLGQPGTDFLVPSDLKDVVLGILTTVLNQQGGIHGSNENLTKNGDRIICEWYNIPLTTPAGSVIGIASMVFDITDRKQQELAFKEQLTAIDATADGVGIVNPQGEYIYLNQAHIDTFGFTHARDLLGKTWRELYYPNEIQRIERDIFPILMQEKRWQGEVVSKRFDGSTFPAEISLTSLDDGKLICICRDISEHKRQEKALRLILEGTASAVGEAFFLSCAKHLAESLSVRYALVIEVNPDLPHQAKSLAFWAGEGFGPYFEYELKGTPCNIVHQERILQRFSHSVQTLFPDDQDLVMMGAESYAGTPIFDPNGQAIGHIAVLDTKPMEGDWEIQETILKIFAARTAAEIQRKRAEEILRKKVDQEQLLNRLISRIRNSLDFETILSTTVQEIQTFLQVDRCHFAWYKTGADEAYWEVVTEVQAPDLPSYLGSYPVQTFGQLSANILNRHILRLDDVDTIPETSIRDTLKKLGNRSMLVLPVQIKSGQFGIIACIHHQTVHPWINHEVELLELVVTQLEIALNQADLYNQTQIRAKELEQALDNLRRTQAQLIQSEKMSSLGQLVAGVAHEINNPVNFIYGNLSHTQDYSQDLLRLIQLYQQHYPEPVATIQAEVEAIDLNFIRTDLPKLIKSMQIGADRIQKIVASLRQFSRMDEAVFKQVDIHNGLESSLMLLQHRLNARPDRPEIQVCKQYATLPQIKCSAGELNQVFMNLLTNALDALDGRDAKRDPAAMQQSPSQIRITTAIPKPNWIAIHIADNGPGISEVDRQRIFDPFFTTKPIGKGKGMGLSISYQIITDHHKGSLTCVSELGVGTEFTIEIPMR